MPKPDAARQLTTDTRIEEFVCAILDVTDSDERQEAINLISNGESRLKDLSENHTFTYSDFRDHRYKTNDAREILRQKVYDELITIKRPENDENIRLGTGGALPRSGILNKERKAFIVIGPPASGKSFFSNKLVDAFGAMMLDSDYAKRKLPEYYNKANGASLVHEESSQIVFKYNYNVLKYSLQNNINIVIPKIGNSFADLVNEFVQPLNEIGYSCFLILIELDRFKATQRAFNRFKETNRYVPLAMIFDVYGNEPILSYYRIKESYFDLFTGFCHFSNDVKRGDKPLLVENINSDDIVYAVIGGAHDEKGYTIPSIEKGGK